MRRVRVNVWGRVQGVSYRASTVDEARRLGLVGWVRNKVDGTVELEAEGTDDSIATLLTWCEYGPPNARVERITTAELAPTGTDKQFSVLPTAR